MRPHSARSTHLQSSTRPTWYVHEGADRESWRDRSADHSRLPRARRALGRRILRGRSRLVAGAHGGRAHLYWSWAQHQELPEYPEPHHRGAVDGLRSDTSRLWVPLRESHVRRDLRGHSSGLHRTAARGHGTHERQGGGPRVHGAGWAASVARNRHLALGRGRGAGGPAHWLPADAEGRGRWWRTRHPVGAPARRVRARVHHGAERSARSLPGRWVILGEVFGACPPRGSASIV